MMEEYLQNVKTLRSHLSDAEDQVAKISLEEQTQITAIQSMEKEFELAKSETDYLKEDTERMMKAKDQMCFQIMQKLKGIESLKAECSIFCQTMELIQEESVSLAVKVKEKRSYYTKIVDDMNASLQEQLADVKEDGSINEIGGKCADGSHLIADCQGHERNEKYNDLMAKLESAKVKLNETIENKSKLAVEHTKMKQSIEQLQCRINGFPPELKAMDIKAMEEERHALLSDKAGETEYLQTLQCRVEQLKGISHVVKCTCGKEYKVEMETQG